jgi:hypothetical protein
VYLTLDFAFHVLDYIVHDFSCRQLADLEYESNNLNLNYFTNCKNKEGGWDHIHSVIDEFLFSSLSIEHMPIVHVLWDSNSFRSIAVSAPKFDMIKNEQVILKCLTFKNVFFKKNFLYARL